MAEAVAAERLRVATCSEKLVAFERTSERMVMEVGNWSESKFMALVEPRLAAAAVVIKSSELAAIAPFALPVLHSSTADEMKLGVVMVARVVESIRTPTDHCNPYQSIATIAELGYHMAIYF